MSNSQIPGMMEIMRVMNSQIGLEARDFSAKILVKLVNAPATLPIY